MRGRRKNSFEFNRCWRQVGGRVTTGRISKVKGHLYTRECEQNIWPLTEKSVLLRESKAGAAAAIRMAERLF